MGSHAAGPGGGVLQRHPPERQPAGRHSEPQQCGFHGDHGETGEGPLMEASHVHALDYLSVFRRRKWWLVTPIVASIFVGLALVRLLPKEYRSSATVGVRATGSPPR